MATLFNDSVSVTVRNTADAQSELRDVPGFPGLKWSFHVYPKGISKTSSYTEVYVRVVGGDAIVKATVDSYNSYTNQTVTKEFEHQLNDGDQRGCNNFCTYTAIYSGYSQKFTCIAIFKPKEKKIVPIMLHELINESKPYCSDAKITVGKSDIKVHRGFLSMISPVFSAMFSPETKESKTGVINITDFTVATIRNSLDYCYGVWLGKKTAAEVIDMLRFFDKYDIQPAIVKLETWLKESLTIENFAPIAAYAWTFSRQPLQATCGRMFHTNVGKLACHPDFVVLDPTVIAGVAQAGLISTGATLSKRKSMDSTTTTGGTSAKQPRKRK